jgi:transposase-like protein
MVLVEKTSVEGAHDECENIDDFSSTSAHGTGRISYTIAFKLRVLTKYDELGGNKSRTAKECGVSRQCVQDWVRDRESLEQTKKERQIAVRKRRHVPSTDQMRQERGKFPHLEERVVTWIKDLRQKGVTISGDSIKRYAKIVYEEHLSDRERTIDFKASNGWLDRFLSRHGLTCRSVTSQGQKIPSNAKSLHRTFFSTFRRRRLHTGLYQSQLATWTRHPCGSIYRAPNHMTFVV